jgi:DNA-binding MarR family transcriptional regulator
VVGYLRLVLDNERRREVSEALSLSFRPDQSHPPARQPMSMRELATALGIDAPYATVVVDDLESQDLGCCKPHPTDRRAKIVEVTRKGRAVARRAEAILGTPPLGLEALNAEDLEQLAEILQRVVAPTPEIATP